MKAYNLHFVQVNYGILWMYLKSFGVCLCLTLLASFMAQVGFDLFANIWLSRWSADVNNVGPNGTVDSDLANMRVGVYGGIGGAQSKYSKST